MCIRDRVASYIEKILRQKKEAKDDLARAADGTAENRYHRPVEGLKQMNIHRTKNKWYHLEVSEVFLSPEVDPYCGQ